MSVTVQPAPSHHIPPPPSLVQDDSAADAVHQRLTPKSRLSQVLSLPKLYLRTKSSNKSLTQNESLSESYHEATGGESVSPIINVLIPDCASITLNDAALQGEDDDTKDRYEWAIVYENQRGMTLFSIPYYSALSLLPTDPSAFTLPNTSQKRSEQPPITLDTYPLPDGDWRWISRTWMIDMRNSDSGIVQHDGFEYNWIFRRHNWRAQVGFLSAGGWVRRRRWVRLMMRPAKNKPHADLEGSTSSSSVSSRADLLRHSIASSNLASLSDSYHATAETVWHGNEDDWKRCRSLMLRYARDGRKLDLWRIWLGYHHPSYQAQFADNSIPSKGERRQKQWTEDDGPLPSQFLEADVVSHRSTILPPREYFVPVLQKHGRDLLQLFVYPDSRFQFLKLLGKAGLLPDLSVSIGSNFSTSEVEFWSYANGLDEDLQHLIGTPTSIPTASSSLPQLPASGHPSGDERD